jgi:bifunctional DNA-binding transcriptional regulator/antitoxin component of YhaV-PrlF toxin-antitoxin module
MQEFTVTLTSKGQLTLPAAVRRALGVDHKGSTLRLVYSPDTKQAKIQSTVDFDDIQSLSKRFIKPGIKPLADPSGYYNQRDSRR